MRKNAFLGHCNWYKGNLHSHTTKSDGKYTPERTVEIYKAHGYNFMALTDHRIYNHGTFYDDDDFLILPGVEVDGRFDKLGWAYHHIVAFDAGEGVPGNPFKDGTRFISRNISGDGLKMGQSLIDDMKSARNHCIYCHPIWSRVELEDILPLEGFFAMEIYNTSSYGCGNVSTAAVYWDSLLRRGRRIWGVATDDGHADFDLCGGWVTVNAPEFTQKAIVENLLAGNFYSSTGPELYDFYIEDGIAYVECSPCRAIHFAHWSSAGHTVFPESAGELLTSAAYKLGNYGVAQYIRVELEDETGKFAWSNPIFLDETNQD